MIPDRHLGEPSPRDVPPELVLIFMALVVFAILWLGVST